MISGINTIGGIYSVYGERNQVPRESAPIEEVLSEDSDKDNSTPQQVEEDEAVEEAIDSDRLDVLV